MNIERLDKASARDELNKFFNNQTQKFEENLNEEYFFIRKSLLVFYEKSKNESNLYRKDLIFALQLYDFFISLPWFTEELASDYDFWIYISIKVVPDIVFDRHLKEEAYYFSKNVRIYLSTLWWYIHMSFQENRDATFNTLKYLNTDYILQLVERPGREGTYITVTRRIMYYIGKIPKNILDEKRDKKTLIRRLLIQNTAKLSNYNLVFDNQEDLYVRELFKSCGIEVKEYE